MTQRIAHYDLLESLGSGGMGEVYRAYDTRLERPVAIKRVRLDQADNPMIAGKIRLRFQREAKAIAKVNHPTVIQIYDLLFLDDVDWIVMEYVEGRSLRRCIRHEPLPAPLVVRLGRQIAAGLAEVHSKGIIHRDLKTDNVIVNVQGRAKIVDFGVVKEIFDDPDEPLTHHHSLVGTARAMSPEQARGEDLDSRSDLFALGSLFYECLAGRSPFEDKSPAVTLSRITRYRQKPLADLDPSIPRELSDLVEKLLDKDPALRPASAAAVEDRLDKIHAASRDEATAMIKKIFSRPEESGIQGFDVEALTSTLASLVTASSQARLRRRRPATIWLGVAAVAILVALAAALIVFF